MAFDGIRGSLLLLLAGATSEVHRAIRVVLERRGHEVVALSSRPSRAGYQDIFDLKEVRTLIYANAVDVIIHAGGPGDQRSHVETLGNWSAQLLDAGQGVPLILTSTTLVLEGFEQRPDEFTPGKPVTPYGRATPDAEQLRLKAPHGPVQRLVNFFCSPLVCNSLLTKVLPWSLLIEGWETSHIGVRSRGDTSKESVDSGDVARAIEVSVASEPSGTTVVAGPGAVSTMGELGEASVSACARAGSPKLQASFGTESSGSSWSLAPGLLADHGWSSDLRWNG